MEEDEECSPIFNYMKQEFEDGFDGTNEPTVFREIEISKTWKKNIIKEYFFSFRTSLVEMFTNRKYTHILSKFENSNVLLEEDTKLVSYLCKEFEDNAKRLTVFEVIWLHQWIFHMFFILVVILFTLIKFANACFLVFICILLMSLLVFHPALEIIYRFNKLSDSLLTVLENVELFNAFSRKVMLFIQESDIVARGFVFVSNKASVGPSGVNFDTNRTRRCPQLRRSLFAALRKSVFQLRDATRTLCDLVPADQCHELMHCIAHIPLSDFGPCLSLPDSDEVGLEKVSDNYSLASLKAMNELANMHCSEFLRKLCIVGHPSRVIVVSEACDNRISVKLMVNAILSCDAVLNATRLTLKKQFDLNQYCLEQTAKSKESIERDQHLDKNSDQGRFRVAVHSLNLHLQAALFKVFEVEKLVGTAASNVDQKLELDRLLQIVSSEMEAASICLDESHVCLNGGLKSENQNSADINSLTKPKNSAESENDIQRIIMNCDPIIQDDVLEALVEADDSACEDEIASVISSEMGSSIEAQRMLTELRSVIVRRARDRRARERRAVRRRAGLPESPCMSSDDCEEDSDMEHPTTDEMDRNLKERERAEAREALQAQYNALSNVGLLRDWKQGAMAAAAARIEFVGGKEECFGDSEDELKVTE